jgi:hypothetical protein
MSTLNDLEARLDAALTNERLAQRALDAVRAANVAADLDGSPEEASAAAELAKAKTQVERLTGAIESLQAAEVHDEVRRANLLEEAQDLAVNKVLDGLDTAIRTAAKAIQAYSDAFAGLNAACDKARAQLSHNPRLRPDLDLPPVARLFEQELVRIASPTAPLPPGHAKDLALWGDFEKTPGLADQLASLTAAARQDLERARQRRTAAEADWSVTT